MTARLLDSNIVSFMAKRHPLAQAFRKNIIGHTPTVSFQTVAELQLWDELSHWGPARRARQTATLRSMYVLQSDADIVDQWAFVMTVRRKRPIETADAWIAATALAFGLELVTHNPADFQGIPGLTVLSELP